MAAEITIKIDGRDVQAALERLRDALGGRIRVEVGTNVVYAAIHHFGGKAGAKDRRVKIPPRPYMPIKKDGDALNQTDTTELLAIVNDFLNRSWAGEVVTGRQVSDALGRYLKTSVQLRFRDQKGPDGKAWPKSRRVELHGGQTLRLTGRMRNSITYRAW